MTVSEVADFEMYRNYDNVHVSALKLLCSIFINAIHVFLLSVEETDPMTFLFILLILNWK